MKAPRELSIFCDWFEDSGRNGYVFSVADVDLMRYLSLWVSIFKYNIEITIHKQSEHE